MVVVVFVGECFGQVFGQVFGFDVVQFVGEQVGVVVGGVDVVQLLLDLVQVMCLWGDYQYCVGVFQWQEVEYVCVGGFVFFVEYFFQICSDLFGFV